MARSQQPKWESSLGFSGEIWTDPRRGTAAAEEAAQPARLFSKRERTGRSPMRHRARGETAMREEVPPMRLLRALLIATAALACMFAAPAQASAANVVPNPSFEQGGCGDTPVICGWVGQSGFMFQGSAHTGQFGMGLGCWQTGCWPSGGWASVGAATDLSACAAIGPGAHPASFWFSGSIEWAALNAAFYQGSDCTGFLGGTCSATGAAAKAGSS
jgi:hypothetical protein